MTTKTTRNPEAYKKEMQTRFNPTGFNFDYCPIRAKKYEDFHYQEMMKYRNEAKHMSPVQQWIVAGRNGDIDEMKRIYYTVDHSQWTTRDMSYPIFGTAFNFLPKAMLQVLDFNDPRIDTSLVYGPRGNYAVETALWKLHQIRNNIYYHREHFYTEEDTEKVIRRLLCDPRVIAKKESVHEKIPNDLLDTPFLRDTWRGFEYDIDSRL